MCHNAGLIRASLLSIATFRQQIKPDARIHAIITKGGDAPTVIPELTSAQFTVRSTDLQYVDYLLKRVTDCANAAALSSGCTVSWQRAIPAYQPMKYVASFCEAFQKHVEHTSTHTSTQEFACLPSLTLRSLPIASAASPPYFGNDGLGSSDAGNVSQILPTIHPYIHVPSEDGSPIGIHTREFTALTKSPAGLEAMIKATKAMALTVLDLATNEALRKKIQTEFAAAK